VNDLLKQILQQANTDEIGSAVGVAPETAKQGLEALLPALTGAAQHKARQDGGLGMLVDAISGGAFDSLLGSKPDAAVADTGNRILGDLFGSKDTSRAVAAKASEQTGIDASLLKKLLPIAASLLMGFLAKQGKAQAPAPAPVPQAQPQSGGGLADILGGMLDKDGDGSFIDDVMGGALGGLFGGRGR
jgi:hypothetical protein